MYILLDQDISDDKPNSQNDVIHDEVLFEIAKNDKNFHKNSDRPIYVGNLNDVINKYTKWSENFPRIQPFYAIKCNDDPNVALIMANLGAGFDCASVVSVISALLTDP